jgi:hypothetical protein
MPASILYQNLIKRESILKTQFLDFQTSESSLPKNQDKLRAFKLLVHAEIESYLENAVLEVWSKCDAEWKKRKKVIAPLKFLIMFSASKFEGNDQQLTKDTRITQVLNAFQNIISYNNGIKKKNILQLVIPLGVDYSSIDQTWLTTIDSYGSSRGQVAHNSFSIQQQLDRSVELENLLLVLNGIKEIDTVIQGLISSRRRPF